MNGHCGRYDLSVKCTLKSKQSQPSPPTLATESYGYALTGRVECLSANHPPVAPLRLQAYRDTARSLGYPLAVVSLIKFIQFKRADFLAAPHLAHLCSEHFSECDFANPMEYRMGFASKLTCCSGSLSKSCLTGSDWYGCILVGLSGKVSVSSSELELAILQRLPRVT